VYTGDTSCCASDAGVFYLGDFVNVTTIGGAVGPGFSTSTAFSSTSTSATIASTTIASTTASTPAASSSLPSSGSSSTGLGNGAKAGIGVGVVVGVIVIVAFGYLIWRNQKTTMKLREQVQMLADRGNEVQKDPRFEPFGIAPYHDQVRYELGGIRNQNKTAELPAEDQRMRGK
jgi:hypothetical protein